MASIVGKKINGGTYYYLVESARVDGQPRIVSQRYLGTAADIGAAVSGGLGPPAATEHRGFGAVAAVWATITRLGVAELVDELLAVRRAAVSTGSRLALAVLHRIIAPTADVGHGEWWMTSAAERFLRPRPDPSALAARPFWRAMDRLTPSRLERLEAELFSRVANGFRIGGDALALDVRSFDTLTSGPDPCGAPRDRPAREPDPVLLGIGMVVSRDGVIPLAAQAYRRNDPGGPDPAAAIPQLADRHRTLAGDSDLTVVLEPGQHERITELTRHGWHVVTALPLADFPELDTESRADYRPVDADRFPGVRAWDTRARVSTVDRRVIAIRSATLQAGQSRAFADALATATRQLDELAGALSRGAIRRSRDRLLAEIAGITRSRRVDRVLTTTVAGAEPDQLRLDWRIDEPARIRLHSEVFGRQLLVTDRTDWSVDEVLTAYRARYYLDSTFRQFGDPVRSAPWPGFRWTEQRIAVHALIGMLATTVTHLMRHDAHRAGLDFSVRELLDCLAGMEETVLRYPSTGGRPRTLHRLTEHTATQQRLFDLFGLRRYAPRG